MSAGSYEQLTIEAVATEARVSKQTIYKWWPSKAAIVTEAAMSGYVGDPPIQLADSGDIAADLRSWLSASVEALADPTSLALVRAMTAAAAEGSDADRIYDQLAMPHRQRLLQRLEHAERAGQLRSGTDLEAAVDALLGFVLYQSLSRSEPAGASRADGLADILINGLTIQKAPEPR